jgi:hypothetical protein
VEMDVAIRVLCGRHPGSRRRDDHGEQTMVVFRGQEWDVVVADAMWALHWMVGWWTADDRETGLALGSGRLVSG